MLDNRNANNSNSGKIECANMKYFRPCLEIGRVKIKLTTRESLMCKKGCSEKILRVKWATCDDRFSCLYIGLDFESFDELDHSVICMLL